MVSSSDTGNFIKEWMGLFQKAGGFYRQMFMLPLWRTYPSHQESVTESLAIFLKGYAFERRGRRPDYPHAAADTVMEFGTELDPKLVWENFKKQIRDEHLNRKNNPLYPSSDPDDIGNAINKKSVIEAIARHKSEPPRILAKHLSELVKNGDTIQAFEFLTSVRGVGSKIASFYLRDLADVTKINSSDIQERGLLQPIDVWVKRTVHRLTKQQRMEDTQIANWIVINAHSCETSPEQINMGIWFYGAVMAGSKYRLYKTLENPKEAHSLIQDYYSRIQDACIACNAMPTSG